MFARFLYALFGFCTHEFPEKSERNLGYFSLTKGCISNKSWTSVVITSYTIFYDKIILCWYGQGGGVGGGDWINISIPMYVSIDRDSKNSSEIQDS